MLLSEAEAHGGGQAALSRDGTTGGADAAAGGGAFAGWGSSVWRDGAGLHYLARRFAIHQGATVRCVGQIRDGDVWGLRNAGDINGSEGVGQGIWTRRGGDVAGVAG